MDINFGNARTLPQATEFEEGIYTLRVESWECKPPKDGDPDRGRNLNIKFSIEDADEAPPVWANVWVQFDNPWGAKLFFEALLERELGPDDSVPDIEDADYYVGERVRCNLIHEPYEDKNGKPRVKFAPSGPDAWLPAS